jgi:predicted alpha/beta-hydrolase family hydrolase
MAAVADGLFERDIASLRYQFPYMEKGSRRPDPPAIAQSAVRAAVDAARRHMPDLPMFAGGKSYGGRMSSQAQAETPLPGVRGLVFLGFPLHPANKPSVVRATHLGKISVPMLFLQGTRDALAHRDLMIATVGTLPGPTTLSWFEDADHSFHVPARSETSDAQIMEKLLDTLRDWIDTVLR